MPSPAHLILLDFITRIILGEEYPILCGIHATESEQFALFVQLAKYFSVNSIIIIERLDMEKRK